MKNTLVLLLIAVVLFSCKKEKSFNPDANITYTYWYQLKSNSVDTLFHVFIPNAFTPNGDGVNDEFFPKLEGPIKMTTNIFNKDGNLVYSSTGFESHWNGKLDNVGDLQPEGVYTYKLIIVAANSNNQYERSGAVMLII